jgi:hypothetical protein
MHFRSGRVVIKRKLLKQTEKKKNIIRKLIAKCIYSVESGFGGSYRVFGLAVSAEPGPTGADSAHFQFLTPNLGISEIIWDSLR